MDSFPKSGQALNEALRLAVIGETRYGAARVVLLYHEAIYTTVQTFIPCAFCIEQGISLEQTKSNAMKLDEQRKYYAAHLNQFGKKELEELLKMSLAEIDLSVLCSSCLEGFEQQLTASFLDSLGKQHIHYHIRHKKR